MPMPIEYTSFLIRLWRERNPERPVVSSAEPPVVSPAEPPVVSPAEPLAVSSAKPLEPTAGWQGEVEHIQSGRNWTFSTLEELLGFLRRQTEDPEALELMAGE
jgi:hypothetical protein